MVRKVSLWGMAPVLILLLLASACECNDEAPPSPVPTDIEQAVRAYFGAWETGEFEEMSALMTPEEEGGEDFAEDMAFAPVTPKNLKIEGTETLSANRVRVDYSLELPELKYIVAGLIVRNTARHDPSCVTLNDEQTRYTSYQDFVVLQREGPEEPWNLDKAEGNALANAIWMMNFTFIFQVTYRSEFPWAPTPPDWTDPTSPEFDKEAILMILATYAVERDLEEGELIELAVPVAEYVVDLIQECE